MTTRQPSTGPCQRLASRGFLATLRLYPASFRHRFGDDMAEVFADQLAAETRRRGEPGALVLLLRTLLHLPASLLAVRRASPKVVTDLDPEKLTMGHLVHDLRNAVRSLRRAPLFYLSAALILGLGIGASTAVFSVLYGILLRPLGLADADRLVVLSMTRITDPSDVSGTSPEPFRHWQEESTSFSGLAAWYYDSATLAAAEGAEEVGQTLVSTTNLFEVIGADVLRGRAFEARDATGLGRGDAVIIGSDWWQRRFGSDPGVIGRKLIFDERPYTVVGIVDSRLPLPVAGIDLWIPAGLDPEDRSLIRRLQVVGRLADSVGAETAQAEMARLARTWAADSPRLADWTIRIQGLQKNLVGNVGPTLGMVAAAVGLLLLITCANVANLLLARAATRGRELATRRALGAHRRQIFAQLLLESLLLGVAGGILGVGLAMALHRGLIGLASGLLPRLGDIAIDGPVLAFAVGLAILTAALFGLAPALHAVGASAARALRAGPGNGGGRGLSRLRGALVAAQMALAVVLLVGAGLLWRTLWQLRAVDPGFRTEGVVGARIYLDDDAYPEDAQQALYFERLLERTRALPGFRAVGATTSLPLDPVTIDFDLPYSRPGEEIADVDPPQADFRVVSPGYFAALGIELRRGRAFDATDHADAEPSIIVNETLARRVWGDEDPIGQSLNVAFRGARERRVVGVVRDLRFSSLAAAPRPEMYVPQAQIMFSAMTVVAAVDGDPEVATAALRQAILDVDSRQPASSVLSLAQLRAGAMAVQTFYGQLLLAFALVATALAAAGVYGVLAYWVSQSRRELGLRMAIGARAGQILGLVLRRGLLLVLVGVAVGLAGALVFSRSLAHLLYGVEVWDPAVLVGVPAALAAIALAACLLPATAASRIAPMETLRYE